MGIFNAKKNCKGGIGPHCIVVVFLFKNMNSESLYILS